MLALIPAWRDRIGEMAVVGPEWRALADNWRYLEDLMVDEVGMNWEKGKSSRVTFAAMRRLIDGARAGA